MNEMDELRRFLAWILPRHAALEAITEVRILDPAGTVWSGYFTPEHTDRLVELIRPTPGGPRERTKVYDHPRSGEANIYFSLQGVEPAVAKDRIGRLARVKTTTKDRDIRAYTIMVVDIDPERPKGCSATAEEKESAHQVAVAIVDWLGGRGIRCILADSGNGYHLLIPMKPCIGAEAIKAAAGKAKLLLRMLHKRFSTDAAKVDISTFNPSRILKVYGTVATKGENSDERPHRLARVELGNVPEDVDLFAILKSELDEFEANAKRRPRPCGVGGQRSSQPRETPSPGSDELRPEDAESAPGKAREQGASDSAWNEWRREALERLDLEAVYGDALTGQVSGDGWLQCRDADSASGDQHPSAGVADGTGEAERGSFHSFLTSETESVFDFLVRKGRAGDFKEACALVAEMTGIPLPVAARPAPPSSDELDGLLTMWKATEDEARKQELLHSMIGRYTKAPPLELDQAFKKIKHETGVNLGTLQKVLKGIKKDRRKKARAAAPLKGQRSRFVDHIANRDTVGSLFDKLVGVLKPSDRFFMTVDATAYVRIGIGTALLSEKNVRGYMNPYVEIRYLRDTGEDVEMERFGPLTRDLAQTFVHDPRVRSQLPMLMTYTRAPVFASDWTFVGKRGYHKAGGGIFYDGPAVEPAPDGVDRLLEGIAGFRWKDQVDMVNFVGVLLTALTMPMWGRGHPFLAINGNKQGVGKSTLAEFLAVLVEGGSPGTVSWIPNDEEFEKQIATRVEAGDRVIVIDNAKAARARIVESACLERTITSSRPNFRRLGGNTSITRPQNDLIFCLTMNLTQLGADLRRRALPVNLHIDEDVRQVTYPFDDVSEYVYERRYEIIAELAGLVRRWIAAGRPEPSDPARHSTSQRWARTIDAILRFNGMSGFLSNFEEASHDFDPDYDLMLEVCTKHHDEPPMTAGAWADKLKNDVLEDRLKDRRGNLKSRRSMAATVSNLFTAYLDATFGVDDRTYRLVQIKEHGTTHSASYHFVADPSEEDRF